MDSHVLQFLDKSRGCRDFASLTALLQQVFQQMGFPNWAYQTENPLAKSEPVIVHNFPRQWVEYYMTHKCSSVDPVMTIGCNYIQPFQWSKLTQGIELTKEVTEYSGHANDFGLRDGLAIPIISPNKQTSMMSMADEDKDIGRKLAVYQNDIIAISFAFHAMAKDLLANELPPSSTDLLSHREKECLLWTMRGKNMWEIGQIIGVSDRTVEFHLLNAKSKLGVSNKYHAIVKAIIQGHIRP